MFNSEVLLFAPLPLGDNLDHVLRAHNQPAIPSNAQVHHHHRRHHRLQPSRNAESHISGHGQIQEPSRPGWVRCAWGCSLKVHTRQQALAAEHLSLKLPQLINQPAILGGQASTHLRSRIEPLAFPKAGPAYLQFTKSGYCAMVDWILSQPCPIDLISLRDPHSTRIE